MKHDIPYGKQVYSLGTYAYTNLSIYTDGQKDTKHHRYVVYSLDRLSLSHIHGIESIVSVLYGAITSASSAIRTNIPYLICEIRLACGSPHLSCSACLPV